MALTLVSKAVGGTAYMLKRVAGCTKPLGFFFVVVTLVGWLVFVFRAQPVHMEVPRLGVKSELQLQTHTTPTAMPY